MQSEATNLTPEPSLKGDWKAYFWEGGDRYRVVTEEVLRTKTPMMLCNGPYALRFTLPSGQVYFIGLDDDLYRHLKGQGKNVLWLHDFFADLRGHLNTLGLSPEVDIHHWPLSKIWQHKLTLDVFPGAKVAVRR